MFMLRKDGGDGGAGGAGGGGRKTHPIFKGAIKGDTKCGDVYDRSPRSYSCCPINCIDSDPSNRPPICLAVVGIVLITLGVAALFSLGDFGKLYAAAIGVTSTGGFVTIASLIWFFITRRRLQRTLAAKEAALKAEELERKLSCQNQPAPPSDPILTRGLVHIFYQSCEDTKPHGSDRTPAGTKAVRVPPSEGYITVESSCFRLLPPTRPNTNTAYKSQCTPTKTPAMTSSQGPMTGKCEGTGRTLPSRPLQEFSRQYSSNSTIGRSSISKSRPTNTRTIRHQMSDPRGYLNSTSYEMNSMSPERQLMLGNNYSSMYKMDHFRRGR